MSTNEPRINERCTFHRDGVWCGKVEADETDHVWPDERMRPGAHVWRHDERDRAGLVKYLSEPARELTSDPERKAYRLGYQAGHQAARTSRLRKW